MIIDELTEFADASTDVVQTAHATNRFNIGDVIDMETARDIGNGQPVYLVVTVDTEIITGGSAGTIQFHLVSDGTATPHATTSTVHFSSPIYVTDGTDANDAELKQGQIPFQCAIPLEGEQYERYLGVQCNVITTDTTAGKVNAFLTIDPHKWVATTGTTGG